MEKCSMLLNTKTDYHIDVIFLNLIYSLVQFLPNPYRILGNSKVGNLTTDSKFIWRSNEGKN